MRKNDFSLGADPELFLLYSNNKPKSAINVVPGTKESPHKISDKGHSVQVDNVLLEFNVPPSLNAKDMHDDILFVMEWFKNNIPESDKLNICSSLIFDKEELTSDKAKEFGCDPDFNAWTEGMNDPPDADDLCLRSAGGHIHISYPNPNLDTSVMLVKALDLFLGVPSVLYDRDVKRRELYGKAGCFRFKKYPNNAGGVEYRTLSNFWIKDIKSIEFIFNGVNKAFDFIKDHDELMQNSSLGRDVINTINTGSVANAKRLIHTFNLV